MTRDLEDNEPAVIELMEELKRRRVQDTTLEHPPARDPQSNGMVEKGVQDLTSMVRSVF